MSDIWLRCSSDLRSDCSAIKKERGTYGHWCQSARPGNRAGGSLAGFGESGGQGSSNPFKGRGMLKNPLLGTAPFAHLNPSIRYEFSFGVNDLCVVAYDSAICYETSYPAGTFDSQGKPMRTMLPLASASLQRR